MAGGAGSGAVFHLIVTSDELILWFSQPGIFLLLLSLWILYQEWAQTVLVLPSNYI